MDISELTYRYIDIHEADISQTDLEKTIGWPARTVPQIFHGETYIDGFPSPCNAICKPQPRNFSYACKSIDCLPLPGSTG